MKKGLFTLVAVLLVSSAAQAGTCKITVVPRPNLVDPQSEAGIFPPIFLRRQIELTEVSINECVERATQELNIDFQFLKDRYEVQKSKYRFYNGALKIVGKVTLKDLEEESSK